MPFERQTSSSSAWRASPSGPVSAKPGREDHEGAHAAGGARTRDAEHRGGRDGEDGELDRAWHLVDRSERSSALHLVRVVVDEMQWSGVARGEDVVHQLPRDRPAAARGTDDHDAVGLEQVTHACDGG